ncbi:MAG: VWD domain-containing protein [Catenulispora sp.]|nr:VWD domain-containing protein [Catenulispora sp.]
MPIRRFASALAVIVAGAVFATSGPMGTVAANADPPPTSTAQPSKPTPTPTPSAPASTTSKPETPGPKTVPPVPTSPSKPSASPTTQTSSKSSTQPPPTTYASPDATAPAPHTDARPSTPGLEPEAAVACPPNSDDASIPASGGERCIAGNLTSTRWTLGYVYDPVTKSYTSVPCVRDPRALIPNAVYNLLDCKPLRLQAENIAQTRVVAQLNAAGVYGDSSATGITPNLQWETVVPTSGERPDLVLYDHTKTTGPVGLVEMKGDWSSADPVAEVTKYVQDWPPAGHTVVPYHFATPISDDFKVQLEPACKYDPTMHPAYLFHTYSDPAHDGVIRISRTMQECPPRQKQGDEDEKKQTYQGTIGADADHNGVDDFWDYIRDHPELWYLTGPIVIPAFHALAKPVMVSLNRDAITEIEEAAADAAPDAIDAEWAALVDSMPEAVADASADILAGDAAALGLDATELAAAELTLDAGFITLSAAFLVPLVAAAVVVAIWAVMHWHLFGDPHMTTLDGLAYDLQDAGEFEVVNVPSLNLDVQARFLPPGGSRTVTVVDSVAFTINGSSVELNQNGTATVNSVPIPASQKLTDFGQGAVLVRDGNKFVATFGAAQARLAFGDSSMGFDIAPGVPTTGLLGNNDGIPGNDLAMSDGTPVTAPTASVLDGSYANSWRLTDNESDFTYPDNNTTASYTDLTFPSNVVTISDFAQSDQDLARQACNAQAVPAGPQFDACMLDVAETGDANYAKAAAAVTDVLEDSAAHTVDAGGTVTEDFEAAVGSNFRPDSTESIGGTTAAGPVFDGSGYSFTVPSLPNHSGATIAFDVYAVGITASNAQNQTLTVKVGDPATASVVAFTPTTASVSSGPATITALGQGQTAQGAAYQRYRITMPTPQYGDELQVQLAPSGFRGIIGTSLAVDDISVGVGLVPAQTFTAALPLSVAAGTVDGVAAAGAGTLENTGSADVYSFTVPSGGQRLNLALGSCPAQGQSDGIQWKLTTSAGRTAASGYCDARSLGLVAAGQYTLTVRGPGVVGSYTLNLEAPQTFAAAVPLSVTANTLNGAATTGAGVFEDGASQDVYSFTVPAGGQQLALSLRSCPSSDNYSPGSWTLVDAATQSVVHSGYGGCSYADWGTLPAGSYNLIVSANGTPGSYTLDVLAPQTFAVTLPLVATANTVNGVSVAGAGTFESGASQDVYTFTAPAGGQTLNLAMSACPTQSYSTPLRWKLVSTATGATTATGGCSYANLGTLAAGGYQLVVSAGGVAGGYALNLEAPQVFASTFPLAVSPGVVNGAAATGAGRFETTASQDVYTLTAPTDGSPVLLNIASCPTVSYSTTLTWKLLDGSGAAIAHGKCGVSSLGVLPAGGYRLAVDSGGMAGTYSLFATAGGAGTPAATLDGTPDVVTTTVAAQSVAIGFTNTTSQTVAIAGSSTLVSGSCDYSSLVFYLYDHTGAEVTHGGLQCGSAGMLYSPVLAAGAYTVLIVPPAPVTAKLGVQVFGASSSAVTATLDGTPASVTTTVASQSVMVSFTNTATQAVVITGSSNITGDCNYNSVKYNLYDHLGTQVKTGSLSCGTTGVLYSPTLAAGTYTMLVTPPGPVTGTYGVQFFGAGASMATAALDGTPASVTTTTASKAVAFGFTVPSSQAVTITGSSAITGDCSYNSVKYYLYDASGTQLKNQSVSCSAAGVLFGATLAAGSYTVLAVPPGPVTGTFGAQVFGAAIPVVATLDGTPASVTTTHASQSAAVRFTVPSSQAVVITGSSAITGDCSYNSVKYYLYDASGTQVKNQSVSCSAAGVLFGATLAAGSYTAVAVPPGPVTGTYGFQVFGAAASSATAALTGAPVSATTTIASRAVAFGFTVPAAEAVTLTGSSAITGDCNYSSVRYYLYDQTGAQVKNTSLSCGSAGLLFTASLAAGSYKVLIVPPGPVTGKYGAQVFAAGTSSATATVGGAQATAKTTVAAQAASIGFTNSAAQNIAFTGSSTITGGTCGYTSVLFYLYDHTGTQLKSGSLSCGSSGSLYTMSALPAGSYTVLIVPTGLVYGTLGLKVAKA